MTIIDLPTAGRASSNVMYRGFASAIANNACVPHAWRGVA